MNNNRYKDPQDLHTLTIPGDQTNKPQSMEDFSVASQDGNSRVFFQNFEDHLIEYIRQCDVVIGCIAWLTSKPILQALAGTKGVSIIVQKEDFLRPDPDSHVWQSNWAQWLRTLYDQLPKTLYRFDFDGTILSRLTVAGDTSIDPVRCIGNHNADKQSAFPRSHHKFVIFCDYVEEVPHEFGMSSPLILPMILPKSVWTGSYNFTKTAGMSFENAVVLSDPSIVDAYFHEYAQIAALSEPLDWERQWSVPEWRIGT